LDYESKGRRFESSRERRPTRTTKVLMNQGGVEGDAGFMAQALALANEAARLGEVPVGALAVKQGVIVGRGYNRREIDRDPFSHAEFIAMQQAAAALGAWRLNEVTVYVTLEPCVMCAGALVQARVSRVVFGAFDPKAGAVGSLFNLVQDGRLNHRLEVSGGVLGTECGAVLKNFFAALRAKANRTTE
jgi:tRNA(adenine34) deaminase